MEKPQRGRASFPTTRWSLVERAADGRLHVRRLALGELLRLYWPALVAHLRRRGHVLPDRADDLLQGFVCDKVVEDGLLGNCRPGIGKFRTFLLTTLDRYLVDQYRKDNARCRAPDRAVTGDHEARLVAHAAPNGDPSDDFDAAWARQTIIDAVRRTRLECEDSGRLDVWGVLRGRLLLPALEGDAVVPYEELTRRLALEGPTHASNLLVTGKRMFQRKLREVVSLYAADEGEIDQEIRDLRRILGSVGSRDDRPE